METKICKKCGNKKNIEEFNIRIINSKEYYYPYCKQCGKKYAKQWREKNHDINLEKFKHYREKNHELVLERTKRWKQKNKEYLLKYNNKEYYKNKKKPLYKMKIQIRNLIRISFTKKGYKKNTKTEQILGCNLDFFNNYILKTFRDNYGYEWDGKENVHIDHIMPLATAKTEDELIKLCHYTNLQLLKAKDNLEKSNKLNWELLK